MKFARCRSDDFATMMISAGYVHDTQDRICSEPIKFVGLAWWRHQMETFSALLSICAGKSPVTGEFPAQRPVKRNFGVFFDLRQNKHRVNNGEAGDLICHRAHYNVTVMYTTSKPSLDTIMGWRLFSVKPLSEPQFKAQPFYLGPNVLNNIC